MLTPKQHNLLVYIDNFIKETGHSPSFEEMKEAVGLKSKSGIHALINALEERGFIRKLAHKARSLEVLKMPQVEPHHENRLDACLNAGQSSKDGLAGQEVFANDNGETEFSLMIPLYGKIAAGTPIEAIANPSEYIYIPKSFSTQSELYALTIEGESMVEAGIFDGDMVIVEQQPTADNGDIVVAMIEDSATVKRFYKEDGYYRLQPENDTMDPIIVSEVSIIGKVVGLYRSMK